MLKHYLKIGFCNLIKYKLQSMISIAGLSVGFVCFCLSALWIHHELTYDNFHKDAHLIYRVRVADTWKGVGLSSMTPYPLAGYLKETFPEIKESCNISGWESSITVNNKDLAVIEQEVKKIPGITQVLCVERALLPQGFGMMAKIVGVIKDFYIDSPTLPVQPVAFENKAWQRQYGDILYKYKDENKKQCEEQILKIMKDKFPSCSSLITNMEDTYTGYLQSEQALLLLLGFVSVVCILVSLFGIYSQASLACEEKRKEIAIRKVNSATVNSILQLFFNEYLLLLGIASFIAFPVGYVIMKPWTENYIRQTEINSWLYLVIFVLAGVVITGSILARVWKAANTNPAIVVKSE